MQVPSLRGRAAHLARASHSAEPAPRYPRTGAPQLIRTFSALLQDGVAQRHPSEISELRPELSFHYVQVLSLKEFGQGRLGRVQALRPQPRDDRVFRWRQVVDGLTHQLSFGDPALTGQLLELAVLSSREVELLANHWRHTSRAYIILTTRRERRGRSTTPPRRGGPRQMAGRGELGGLGRPGPRRRRGGRCWP